MADIGILQQRRIEAAFAKGIFEEMAAELGKERAKEILSRAVVKLAKQAAAEMAAEAPEGPSLAHFISQQERWTRDDALQIEVVGQDATSYAFNVKRCRYAETYKAMGLAELGAVLSCNRDGAFSPAPRPSWAAPAIATSATASRSEPHGRTPAPSAARLPRR
jgi:pantoate kinase